MSQSEKNLFRPEEFVPSLAEATKEPPFTPDRLILVAIPIEPPGPDGGANPSKTFDRRRITLTNGEHVWTWDPENLQSLFRGDLQPPSLGSYPESYNLEFSLLEQHLLEAATFYGVPRDLEMLEIYSTLRRRPDGRSLGRLHDYMWQAAAFLLGSRVMSQAEFEAIMSRLERSCRTFQQGSTSRNYVNSLRSLERGSIRQG